MEEATCLPHAWQRVFNSVGVDELEATKYNPNHDSRGRFSGGGSGRVSAKVKLSRAKARKEITADLRRQASAQVATIRRATSGASKVKRAASGGASRTVELLPADGKTMRSTLYPAGVGVKLTPRGKTYQIQSFREEGSAATARAQRQGAGDVTRRAENVQLIGMITKVEGWRSSANGRDLTAAKWIAKAALEERMEHNHSRGVGYSSSGGHVDLIIARQKNQVSMDATISGVIAVSTRGRQIYVDYLATNPTASGTGVGSHLLRAAAIQGVQLGMNGLKLQALSTASTYYHRTMGMTPSPHGEMFSWSKAQMTRFAKTGKLPTGVTLKYYEELKLGGDYGRMAKEPTQLDAMEEAYSQEPADGAFVSKREVFSPRQVFAPKRIMLDYARTRAKALVNDQEEDTDYFDELGNEIKYNDGGAT